MNRIGFGYDIHRLVEGRKLILGGIDIPFDKGLSGHSDADVLIHAMIDGLLGAATMGDIGHLFPDNDPQFKDIDSMVLLKKVFDLIQQKGFSIVMIDSTIVCEKPKLAPYIVTMRENIAQHLGIPADSISVKATTNERIGDIGKGEAICAMAVVLLDKI